MTLARLLGTGAVLAMTAALSGCKEENTFRAPPPPQVGVATPLRQPVTRFHEATGVATAVNSIDLVARVPGYIFQILYKDGQTVKKGEDLFVIEPSPYQAKLLQAQAALTSANATYLNADAEFGRQSQLGQNQFSSRATVDQARAKRDTAAADIEKAKGDMQLAAINLSYTHVTAPFDGVASAKLASIGDLVGQSGATKLATVVQLDPIYVTFNVGERDVLEVRSALARTGAGEVDLSKIPIEVGLANEDGFPHKGVLDYVSPGVDPQTGTVLVRGILPNEGRAILPGMFVRTRVPLRRQAEAILIPDAALGSDLGGRYALIVSKDDVVEQRRIRPGPLVGHLRVIEDGLKPEDRVIIAGNQRAVPGLKVAPQPATIAPAPMIARFFIDRPVLANVLSVVLVLLGIVALYKLPVAQYPDVVPPTVQVTARYPGANAQTVIDTIALPIEQQVNGVEKMIYMQSISTSDGSYTLTVTFDIGTDLDFAQVLVQNRVSAAMSALPQAVQAQGVNVQKKSTAILQIVTLTSPNGANDSLYLSNYATISLRDELSRLPGVGNVAVFGAGSYAMRIWMDPGQLQARGMVPADVIAAIQAQSRQVTAGQIGMPPTNGGQDYQYTINVAGRFDNVEDFGDIIVRAAASTGTGTAASGGRLTRLRDVARVELGAKSYGQTFNVNGAPAAGLAIFQSPGANALDVAKSVRAKMTQLSKAFPQGVAYAIPFDTTGFVSASIDEVYHTLVEAAVLVLLVILIFLQDWRATLVPATTVPVTIIGTFAAMAVLGFSINLSTLFAIILAIGIVVDDAIVVVEGVIHYIEKGYTARDAAVKAMDELLGPIMGITLVLMAVFIPAAFLPGLTGRMYAQFALVIAATAIISAINAVTLKPTQCALWLKPLVPPEKRNFFYRGFNRLYDPIERAYARMIGRMARSSVIMAVISLVLIALGAAGIAKLPTAFLPIEDQGYLLIAVQLPDGAALERTQRVMDEVTRLARDTPGVETVISIGGVSVLDNNVSLANAGVAYVILKDWSKRKGGQEARFINAALTRKLDTLQSADAFVLVPPPIQGIGNAGGFSMQVELRDGAFDYARLQAMARNLIEVGATQSGLQKLRTSFRAEAPQLDVSVDRVKAESLRVSVGDVFSVLGSYLGSGYVDQFTKFGRIFQIYVQADAAFRLRPEDIAKLFVRSRDGTMVPLSALVEVTPAVGPSLISLYNLYPSATILGSPAGATSSGQAIALMEQMAARELPPGAGYDWTAMSFQEKIVGSQIYVVFALGMLLVYLVLAAQYESWIAPMAVIFSVPLSLLGPVIGLGTAGIANNLYVQIGLVLLIALSAKNAILIVEAARERRAHGMPILDAAIEAARNRFRPIVMTSFAFILGVVPLVIATGAGANARRSLGMTVFSGMLASTLLAVLFVPSFFVLMQRLEERIRKPQAAAPASIP